jgi:ATP-binding cassette subfamily B protein
MPGGYDTILHEGGINLSGGQRQRIAIARAILLEPSILLLDDPTASVDPETEKEIMTAIENAMEGRTTFIVANRISTLKRSDRVIVLHGGKVVQSGTHSELMLTSGYYQAAANLQIPDAESLRLLEMTGLTVLLKVFDSVDAA